MFQLLTAVVISGIVYTKQGSRDCLNIGSKCVCTVNVSSPVQIILSRESEVLALECEMSAVHGLLSKIPEQLSFEQIIVMAHQLFEKHPPKKLARHGGLKLNTRSESVSIKSKLASCTHNPLYTH